MTPSSASPERPPVDAHDPSTVLILDDDPAIAATLSRLLARAGHDVLTAPDARTAREVVEERGTEIDLILCDLVLPDMGGREAANVMQLRAPHAVLVFMSGYSSRSSGRLDVREAGYRFLSKPFEIHEVLETVQEALAEAGARRAEAAARSASDGRQPLPPDRRRMTRLDLGDEGDRVLASRGLALSRILERMGFTTAMSTDEECLVVLPDCHGNEVGFLVADIFYMAGGAAGEDARRA